MEPYEQGMIDLHADLEHEIAALKVRVAALREVVVEAVRREYNAFEPDNQSEAYRRWRVVLAATEESTDA